MLCDLVRSLRLLGQPAAEDWNEPEWSWLRQHLQQCSSCQNWWQREQNWDKQLRQALQNIAAPKDLPEQILARLGNVGRQRWHYRVVTAALTASALLAVSVVLLGYWWLAYRPLDLTLLRGPIPLPDPPSAENVSRLLEQHGIYLPEELQRRWDFRHLKAIYYSYEQGYWLCNLEFRREDCGAQVVVKLVPRRWCRADQIEAVRFDPRMNLLGVEEGGPYLALVIGDPDHIASFYRPGDAAS
ncbi:MAG: hypothetical protein RMI91_07090 [Gemmatales bacterium]|nr:DUF3379 domain-containing protein [Gemmatales bacterium]MDW7994403.1 hypothetical protein [Gemmatales bacterium]